MNLIRDYRKAAGMTQTELAMSVGCRRETIANLEKDRYNPSLALADKIASELGCTLYELFPLSDSTMQYQERISSARKQAYQDFAKTASELASEL